MKKFQCPNCPITLKFDPTKYQDKIVTCPKCQKSAPFAQFKEVEEAIDEGSTEMPNAIEKGKMYKPGQLQFLQNSDNLPWLSESKTISLERGENIMGRNTLPIKDDFMSRAHAIIEVVFKKDSTFVHYLRDNKSRNKTFHNNTPLEEGDIIKLNPNDIIKLGHTTCEFITS